MQDQQDPSQHTSQLPDSSFNPKFNLSCYKKWSSILLSALLVTILYPLTSSFSPPTVSAAPLAASTNTWANFSNLTTGTTPPPRTRMIAAWDPVNNQMIIHSGFYNGASLNDTWKLSPSTGVWTQFSPDGDTPFSRVNGCGVWDTLHNQLLVVGGQSYGSPSGAMDIVWSFNPNSNGGNGTWKQFVATGPEPGSREGVACAWDPVNSKMIVYGGFDQNVYAFEPGAGTTGNWVKLVNTPFQCGTSDPVAGPGNRRYTSYVWNPLLSRMLVWGGRDGCDGVTYFDDMWSFDPNGYTDNSGIWTKLNVTGPIPPARDRAAMVWDTSINQMVIFGSANTSVPVAYNDVWSFRQTSITAGQWSQLNPKGTAPYGRADDGAVYDPIDNQTLYFGGYYYDNFYVEQRINELWGRGAAPTPGVAAKLNFVAQPPATANAGQILNPQPQVAIQDAYNTTITDPASATTITLKLDPLSGCPVSGRVSGNLSVTANTVNGVATFNNLSVSPASNAPYHLIASANGYSSATSNPFVVGGNPGCTITVNNPADNAGDTTNVTLRFALKYAPSGTTINFAPSLQPGQGEVLPTIHVSGAKLPDPAAGVIIDACNASTHKPGIALDGTGANAGVSGLTLSAGSNGNPGNTVKGLAIINFKAYGLNLNASAGNVITCNYIGTDDGIQRRPNALGGIYITGGGAGQSNLDNFIGQSNDPTSGNLISGNNGPGLLATGVGARINLFYNYLGLRADGVTRLNNAGSDLKVSNQAHVILRQGNKSK